MLVPGVRAFAREQLDDTAIHSLVVEEHVASFALENSDRNSPDTLSRDAPIGARRDHVRDAFFTPSWVPLYLADLFERAAAQRSAWQIAFHGNEPLLGSAKDDGIVAAPAVRIRVL